SRQHLEIIGVVRVRGTVEDSPTALDVPEVLQLLQTLTALEHQVLEQMGETRTALRFGAEPHVVVHADTDDRGGPVGSEYHTQAVVESESCQIWCGHVCHPTGCTRRNGGHGALRITAVYCSRSDHAASQHPRRTGYQHRLVPRDRRVRATDSGLGAVGPRGTHRRWGHRAAGV